MRPSLTSTLCSFTQAEVTLRRVLLARLTPTRRASSKLLSERALISVTRATDWAEDPLEDPPDGPPLGLMIPPSCRGEISIKPCSIGPCQGKCCHAAGGGVASRPCPTRFRHADPPSASWRRAPSRKGSTPPTP